MEQEINNNLGSFVAILFIGTILFGCLCVFALTLHDAYVTLNKKKNV